MNAPFLATKWESSEAKAKFFAQYQRFVRAGCLERLFTSKFYQRLSNMFGHIAHYDRNGFYETWCSSPEKRLSLLRHDSNAQFGGIGDPALTWSDVERAVIAWLTGEEGAAIIKALVDQIASERELIERAELARLSAKYGAPAVRWFAIEKVEGDKT